jgi:hypothetical protein
MRKLLQKLLTRPVNWLANRFSSRPDKERVFAALSELYQCIEDGKTKKGLILEFDAGSERFVILSDQHKGAKNYADDFVLSEKNFLSALEYYYRNNFYYINLGDSEELWENSLSEVKKNNTRTFQCERLFARDECFMKIFGNHDLFWDNDPFAQLQLQSIYNKKITIYEGAILRTSINDDMLNIFLTHGHQGDLQSDGNWFSKWFVSNVWAPLQAYLHINPNTPAYDVELKTEHNKMMYEWSSTRKHLMLITGHTHQPVFGSLTLLERLYRQLALAQKAKDAKAVEEIESHITVRRRKGEVLPDFTAVTPVYFNTGCCCFNDGDITAIEIAEGKIRLIKWEYDEANNPKRIVLEEETLEKLMQNMKQVQLSNVV